jgi:transcriptional regulator with XRE-family HTH domain
MATETQSAKMHLGRKISRIRELRGMKQETLAAELGVSQQAISKLEQSEYIDDEKLEMVGKVLGVNADAIKNFSEEATVNYIANTFNGNSGNYMNFNPIEKIVELYESKIMLFERMLKDKDEAIAKLERMLDRLQSSLSERDK